MICWIYHIMHMSSSPNHDEIIEQLTCSDMVIVLMLVSLELQGSTCILTLLMNWYMYLQTISGLKDFGMITRYFL